MNVTTWFDWKLNINFSDFKEQFISCLLLFMTLQTFMLWAGSWGLIKSQHWLLSTVCVLMLKWKKFFFSLSMKLLDYGASWMEIPMQLNSPDQILLPPVPPVSPKVSTLNQKNLKSASFITKTFHSCYKKSHPSGQKETGSIHKSLQTRQPENIRSKLINWNVIRFIE